MTEAIKQEGLGKCLTAFLSLGVSHQLDAIQITEHVLFLGLS